MQEAYYAHPLIALMLTAQQQHILITLDACTLPATWKSQDMRLRYQVLQVYQVCKSVSLLSSLCHLQASYSSRNTVLHHRIIIVQDCL